MKKIALLTLAIISFNIFANAQQDPRAKKILDHLSAITKGYKNISATFTYTMNNEAQKINATQKGKLTTQGNSYYLNLAGQEIFCNGKTIWTYISGSNEVQINNVPTGGQSGGNYINPASLFTIYNKDFKYAYKGEKTIAGHVYQIIDLYPMKPEGKSYHTIVLTINKAHPQIHSIEMKGKDGTNFTYTVDSFVTNKALPGSDFSFNKAKHPGVEVTDLR